MVHHCDRCRAAYESGAFFGGHDYCMTCYNLIKTQDDAKRREADEKRQQNIEKFRKLHAEQLRDEYERKLRADHAELRRRELESAALAKKRETPKRDVEEEMRKRRMWEAPKIEKVAPPFVANMPKKPEKKEAEAGEGIRSGDISWPRHSGHMELVIEEGGKKKEAGSPSLGLSVAVGLPVSLSLGQKDVRVELVGLNQSMGNVEVELSVSASDSKGKTLKTRLEPAKTRIDPSGQGKFEIKMDVPEDAARGPLRLEAYLKESAFYLDHESGRSDPVMLSAQLKTPMDLQYKKESAAIKTEEGAISLCLLFNNSGESGGILSKKSSVACVYDEAGNKKTFLLAKETKVKGLQKNILLPFAYDTESMPKKISLLLVGVDSNGKPYEKRQEIKIEKDKQKKEQ